MTTTPVHSITDEQIADLENHCQKLHGFAMTSQMVMQMITRLREAEKDAARYRWLRDSGNFSPSAFGNGWSLNCGYTRTQPSLLDTAIDTAMQEHTK